MRASEAQTQMKQLEQQGREFTVEEFLTWLLDLSDDCDYVGLVAQEESERAMKLAKNTYGPLTRQADEEVVAGVAFLQGATFAAAALGREPQDAS